jgi:hypothetical protein
VSLLLRYSSDYEFVPRRLRDYFALHRVLRHLHSGSVEQRTQAIEILAFKAMPQWRRSSICSAVSRCGCRRAGSRSERRDVVEMNATPQPAET